MFHYIAGGALGLGTSMKGGFEVAALGVFFHYFIAFAFTLFYFLTYPKLPVLYSNKYLSGLVYGLFVWAVMNFLVLPLSMLPQHAFSWNGAIIAALILMFLVGLPISIGAHNYYRHIRVEKKDEDFMVN